MSESQTATSHLSLIFQTLQEWNISLSILRFAIFLDDFPGGSDGKASAYNAGDLGLIPLGQEDSLRKEMATHSSILAWKIPWMEEPGGPQPTGSQSWTGPSSFTSHSLRTASGYMNGTVGQGGLAGRRPRVAKSRTRLGEMINSGSQGNPRPSDPQPSFMLLLQGSSHSHFNLAKSWPHLWGHGPIQPEARVPSSDLIAFWHAWLLPGILPVRFMCFLPWLVFLHALHILIFHSTSYCPFHTAHVWHFWLTRYTDEKIWKVYGG